MAGRVDYVRSETDLFSEPGYDVSINSTLITEHHPLSSITESAPIEFVIQGNDQHFLDLSKTKLKLRFRVVNSTDGAAFADVADTGVANYAPVNYLLASAFDRVVVHLNETEITPKASLYPYQCYLETLLSYGSDFKKSQATAAGFFRVKDEASQTDDGWTSRKAQCNASAEWELIGKPHGAIFSQGRYLPPGIDVRISFYRSPTAFCMESRGSTAKVVKLLINEAKMYVTKVSLLPSIHMAQLKNWKAQPCIYPGKQVVMKSYSLPIGTQVHTNENLLTGLIPDRLIIGLIATANMQGSLTTNPFNFKDHGLSQIVITCNAETTTQRIINIDNTNNRIVDGFTSLFDAMGISQCDAGLDLNLSEYKAGKFLFGFDLANLTDGFSIPRHGNCSIFLKFRTPLAASVSVIVFPEYPSCMYISHDKQVFFKDYNREI